METKKTEAEQTGRRDYLKLSALGAAAEQRSGLERQAWGGDCL